MLYPLSYESGDRRWPVDRPAQKGIKAPTGEVYVRGRGRIMATQYAETVMVPE